MNLQTEIPQPGHFTTNRNPSHRTRAFHCLTCGELVHNETDAWCSVECRLSHWLHKWVARDEWTRELRMVYREDLH